MNQDGQNETDTDEEPPDETTDATTQSQAQTQAQTQAQEQEPPGGPDRPPATDTDDWVTITDLKVSASRIYIPDRPRERHDISLATGDDVDVVVRRDPTTAGHFFKEAEIGSRNRILLDGHRVEKHDLEGAVVDIDIRLGDDPETGPETGTEQEPGEE